MCLRYTVPFAENGSIAHMNIQLKKSDIFNLLRVIPLQHDKENDNISQYFCLD